MQFTRGPKVGYRIGGLTFSKKWKHQRLQVPLKDRLHNSGRERTPVSETTRGKPACKSHVAVRIKSDNQRSGDVRAESLNVLQVSLAGRSANSSYLTHKQGISK